MDKTFTVTIIDNATGEVEMTMDDAVCVMVSATNAKKTVAGQSASASAMDVALTISGIEQVIEAVVTSNPEVDIAMDVLDTAPAGTIETKKVSKKTAKKTAKTIEDDAFTISVTTDEED